MFKAIKNYITRIRVERALGIKLYDWQKDYIFGKSFYRPNIRASGKTLAYQLKFLLDYKEPPININWIRENAEYYTDAGKFGNPNTLKYVDWYLDYLIGLYETLKDHHIKVREIIF